jgi:hypothetical protein
MVKTIGRWSTKKSPDEEKEKAAIKEIHQRNTPDGKYGGGGSVHDWQQVMSQFLEGLKLLRVSFSIVSSSCL